MPRLPDNVRSEAIGMLRAGASYRALARRLNCHHSTILRLETRYEQTGTVKDRPRPGHPRVTTRRQDGTITRLHERDCFRPSSVTARRMRGRHGDIMEGSGQSLPMAHVNLFGDQETLPNGDNSIENCESSVRATAGDDSCVSNIQVERDDSKPTKRPPRSERKRQRYQELLVERRENRKNKKMERKARMNSDKDNAPAEDTERLSKRDVKILTRQRLQDAMLTGQKICIDCSLEDHMSEKEKGKLAMQIGRLYGANKKADCPAHVYITGLDKQKSLFQECVKKNDGFQHYLMDIKQESHTELFPLDKIVYLSPDSDNLLGDIDPDKIYIIGGLVDESITKNITETKAKDAGVATARLPISEYMDKAGQNTYSNVLAINQVFDIILTYVSTKDWSQALTAGVPRRKGFLPKDLCKT